MDAVLDSASAAIVTIGEMVLAKRRREEPIRGRRGYGPLVFFFLALSEQKIVGLTHRTLLRFVIQVRRGLSYPR